jgi:hypothetical protein
MNNLWQTSVELPALSVNPSMFFKVMQQGYTQFMNIFCILGLVAFIWVFCWFYANSNAYQITVPTGGTVGLNSNACNNRVLFLLSNNGVPDTPSVLLPSCSANATVQILPA